MTLQKDERAPVDAVDPAGGASAPEAPASRRGKRARKTGFSWEKVLFWLLIATVLLAPLPAGSNRPLSATLLFMIIGALLAAWGVGVLLGARMQVASIRPVWPALALFTVVAAWAALQAAPFTPEGFHHPVWREAGEVLETPVQGAISVNPEATLNRLLGWLAYGAIFWLAFQLCRSREQTRQVVLALALGGLGYAVYGLFELFAGDAGVVTSTFVNRNNYATYAGITLLCGLGLVLSEVLRVAHAHTSLQRAALDLLARIDAVLGLALVTCLVAATALLLTQSRGALVALGAALAVFVWALRSMTLITSRALIISAIAFGVISAGAMVWLAGEETLSRFDDVDVHAVKRFSFYATTWQAIGDRPLLGTGYGTYADAFKAYNHPGTEAVFVKRAHNTYLQMIMELGWPAAMAAFACVGFLTWRCAQALKARRRSASYLASVISAATLVAVHSLLDFSLQIPANAVTFALLLGAGCALASSPGGSRTRVSPTSAEAAR